MIWFGWSLLLLHAAVFFIVMGRIFVRHRDAIADLPEVGEDTRASLPPAAALVPARDEEVAVGAAVESLLRQDYPRLTVVVANDNSRDNTRAILADLEGRDTTGRLRVLDVPEPPPGWMGKCHALAQAAAVIPDDVELLLFTDADIVHAPDTLARAAAVLQQEGAGLVALVPMIECVGFWEHAVLPMLMNAGGSTVDPAAVHDPDRPDVFGIGAFSLVRRDVYEKLGGHEAIKGEVVDDVALGMMVKRQRVPIRLVRGGTAVSLRMYDGLRSIIHGFEKNMHAAIGGGLGRAAAGAFAMIALHSLPLVALLLGAVLGNGPLVVAAALFHVLTGVAIWRRTTASMKIDDPWKVILGFWPGAVLCGGIMLWSAYLGAVRGEVRWRGRSMPLGEQQAQLYGRDKLK